MKETCLHVTNIIGSIIILSLGTYFGLHKQPTEMTIIMAGGAILLGFLNFRQVTKLSGLGFSLERTIDEANKVVDHLRKLALSSSELTLTNLAADCIGANTTLAEKCQFKADVIRNLEGIEANPEDLKQVEGKWNIAMAILFQRSILAKSMAAMAKNTENYPPEKIRDFHKAFSPHFSSRHWTSATTPEIQATLDEFGVDFQDVKQLIEDLKAFEESGRLRRPDVFYKFLYAD